MQGIKNDDRSDLSGAHDIQWMSVLRRPERSGDSGAALTDRWAAERSVHGNSRNGDVSEYQFVLRNVHKWWV